MTVKLKRSAVEGKIPTTSNLELGELAINTYDGKIYLEKDDGTAAVVGVTMDHEFTAVNSVKTINQGLSTSSEGVQFSDLTLLNSNGANNFLHLRENSDAKDIVFYYNANNFQIRSETNGGGKLYLEFLNNDGTVAFGNNITTTSMNNIDVNNYGLVFSNISDAENSTINSEIKSITTKSRSTYNDNGGARYTRMSLADITSSGYPSVCYFRSTDRYMPDGSTNNTNGGYWVLDDQRPTFETFGADGSANGDCSVAFEDAAEYSKITNKVIYGTPGATYEFTNRCEHEGTVRFNLNGAKVLKTTTGGMFQFYAAMDTVNPYMLTANYSPGDMTIEVEDTGTALERGQHILILSDAVNPIMRDQGNNAAQYRCAEWVEVGEQSNTTSINLTRPLELHDGISPTSVSGDEPRVNAYTTSLNARIYIPDKDAKFEFRNGEIEYSDGHYGYYGQPAWTGNSLVILGYRRGVLEDVRQVRGYSSFLSNAGTNELRVNRCYADDLADYTSNSQFGYGITDKGLSTIVTDCGFHNCRSGTDTGGNPMTVDETGLVTIYSAAGSRDMTVQTTTGTGTPQRGTAVFGCHHGSYGLQYKDIVCNAAKIGMALRGKRTRAINNNFSGVDFGVMVLTELDNNEGASDDLRAAGNTVNDYSIATIIDTRIQCNKIPLSLEAGTMRLGGRLEIETAGHRLIKGAGEETPDPMHGHMEFGCSGYLKHYTAGGSLLPYVENDKGIFHLEQLTQTKDIAAFENTKVTVSEGVDFTFDVAEAVSNTIYGVFSEDTSSEFINRGVLRFKLPSDGVLFSSNGVFSTEGNGVFYISLDGVSDNSNDHNLIGRKIKVRSEDGTVVWNGETPDKQLQPVYLDHANTLIAGTGWGPYDFNIDNLRKHFGTLGEGYFRIRQRIRKEGAAGTASITWRDFGTFLESVTMDADADLLEYTMDVIIRSDTEFHVLTWGSSLINGANSLPFGGERPVTLAGGSGEKLSDKTGTMIDMNPSVSGADKLVVLSTELYATSGGIF